jgi:hypothetical protein
VQGFRTQDCVSAWRASGAATSLEHAPAKRVTPTRQGMMELRMRASVR